MKLRYWILGGGEILMILVALGVLALAASNFGGITALAGRAGGGNSGGTGGGNNNLPNPVRPNASLTPVLTPTDSPTPTVLPTTTGVPGGPYVVKQTMKMGDETLGTPTGGVCTNRIFQIPIVTSRVSFSMVFQPNGVGQGFIGNRVSYGYSLPDLGETDNAEGQYTLLANADGTVTVTMDLKDHTVFNGADTNVPIHYQFLLVPMNSGATCG